MSTLTKFFNIMNANTPVKVELGANPLRIYPYGTKLDALPRKPYALYGVFNAIPYNYLSDRCDMDQSSIQVDIYAETSAKLEKCFSAIRNAIDDSEGYVTNYSTPDRDIQDGLYHMTLEIDFHEER